MLMITRSARTIFWKSVVVQTVYLSLGVNDENDVPDDTLLLVYEVAP